MAQVFNHAHIGALAEASAYGFGEDDGPDVGASASASGVNQYVSADGGLSAFAYVENTASLTIRAEAQSFSEAIGEANSYSWAVGVRQEAEDATGDITDEEIRGTETETFNDGAILPSARPRPMWLALRRAARASLTLRPKWSACRRAPMAGVPSRRGPATGWTNKA